MARIAEALDTEPASLDQVTEPVDFEAATLVDGVITRNDDLFPAFAFREFSSGEDADDIISAGPSPKCSHRRAPTC